MKLINKFRENEEDQFIGGMPIQLEKKCIFSMSADKDWGCLFLSKYVRGKYYERDKIN